ncbi:uncharacterized protein PV09_01043 [Verruconis gallopava]|uniref:Centromere protein H C-terminal domain-containing protein n=1 Tax=Verruconis gallopava TaxID=253628 RepID=A0A0D2ANL8_9PEZI|nr:uncharacterized protein PV09_01043 [Verruconis gallopava]KIW08105.1 hypothetical protein PV09_01043 [Verruconis gallopava]
MTRKLDNTSNMTTVDTSAGTAARAQQELGQSIDDLTKTPASDAFRFTELEKKILELWDKIEDLRLERHVLEAQHEAQSSQDEDLSALSDAEVQTALSQAERDLLTARSTYSIRQNIIQNVLITDPILKSIHLSSNTTSLERRLLPLVHERDVLTMLSSTLYSRLRKLRQKFYKLETKNIEIIESNRSISKRMLELANDVKIRKIEDVTDERARKQLEDLDAEVRRAAKEWRVWKSVAGAVVVASGIDWAEDPELLEIVMDEEDEMESL